jgi:uncharacterized membrane protein YphA (DoxX/SURF4 family)
LLWVLTVAVAVGLLLAGATKFTASETWIGLFEGWSYPAWFSYAVGAVEVVGALVLVVPRYSTYAAGVLMLIMAGAIFTLLTNPGEMGPAPAVFNFVGLAVIAYSRRGARRGMRSA